MNHIQAMIDGMNAQLQKDRSGSQMTLGELIARLELMPMDFEMQNIQKLHSYRGYYCDLAFSLQEGVRPVSDVLAECKSALGKVFEGYKGGDYLMGESTPLWIADYGCCGDKLIGLNDDGTLITQPDEE